jgi:hypothetical protein
LDRLWLWVRKILHGIRHPRSNFLSYPCVPMSMRSSSSRLRSRFQRPWRLLTGTES